MPRFAWVLFLSASSLLGQSSSGTIEGSVLDPTGAAIPGAQIRLVGSETGAVVREITTNAEGIFTAPLLRPMTYTVEASAGGFKKLVRSGIVLRVDDVLNLRLGLEVGTATDSVTVTANVELLEQTTNTV